MTGITIDFGNYQNDSGYVIRRDYWLYIIVTSIRHSMVAYGWVICVPNRMDYANHTRQWAVKSHNNCSFSCLLPRVVCCCSMGVSDATRTVHGAGHIKPFRRQTSSKVTRSGRKCGCGNTNGLHVTKSTHHLGNPTNYNLMESISVTKSLVFIQLWLNIR